MNSKRAGTLWLQVGILLAMFTLAITSLRAKSPTFDEQGFLTRGVAYLRGENRQLRVGHPLGLNALNAAFLSIDERVVVPTDDPSWQGTNFHRPSELFLWEVGNDVERIMFQGRLPTIFLGLVLTAVAGRWAWELTHKRWVGVLAMLLLALDPNILAHMRLATTDLGLAAAALLAGYTLWGFWKRPGWRRALIAGGTFGLLLNTKFTAGLFIPLFALAILIAFIDHWRRRRSLSGSRESVWRPLLVLITCYPLAALLVLWASYGFQVGTLPESLPMAQQLSGTTWPASDYLEQLLDIGGRMQKSTPAFLMGEYSDDGWWYYFPVAFVLKTPLPVLILLGWAGIRLLLCWFGRLGASQCPSRVDVAILLLPALGYFAFALTTDINLGYRHLLPILPFLAVFTAAMLSGINMMQPTQGPRVSLPQVAVGLLVAGLALATLAVYPHFLSYFNIIIGGPDGGWRALVDSNLDWGQDLAGLSNWLEETDTKQVYLSYFGEARPEYYGIKYVGLDSYPPRLMNPLADPLYPSEPAPGTYAISATTLQGVHFENHNVFQWFRKKEPIDKIGNSIFIYNVPISGEAVDLSLGGIQLEDIPADSFNIWSSNDVTPHWFEPRQSLLIPAANRSWLAITDDASVHPRVLDMVTQWEVAAENEGHVIYEVPQTLWTNKPPEVSFSANGNSIDLNQVAYDWREMGAGDSLTLETLWTKHGDPTPVKLFVHVTDADGNIVAQWDGLGALWQGWRDGDSLWQTLEVMLPESLGQGAYDVSLGVYEPDSGRRWETEVSDLYHLDQLVIGG